jgi:pimeloyl-ACP methyl ester carboxylesterase
MVCPSDLGKSCRLASTRLDISASGTGGVGGYGTGFIPGPILLLPFPLLLIHGFGANLNQWRHNLPSLKSNETRLCPLFIGFGDAAQEFPPSTIPILGGQVADFIDQVVGRPVLLVGHSLGASVALTVTHRYPQRVERLAMVTLPLAAAREDLVAGWVSNLALRLEAFVANPLLLRALFRLVRRPWFCVGPAGYLP